MHRNESETESVRGFHWRHRAKRLREEILDGRNILGALFPEGHVARVLNAN